MSVHLRTTHRQMNGETLDILVQRPFGGWFKKYIQIERAQENDFIEADAWRDELNRQFELSLKIDHSGGDPESIDMRLMNSFIAKVRYN